MTEFQHACFISYKHPPKTGQGQTVQHFWVEFIEALEKQLLKYLTVGLGVYRDTQLQSAPGVEYDKELSEHLCKSACLVAIIVPEYLESSWCLAEWEAMEKLAEKRARGDDAPAMIIPILFRGEEQDALKLAKKRTIINFSLIDKPNVELNTKKNRRTIETLAQKISALATKHQPVGCEKFILDVGEETKVALIDDPDPMA